MPGRSTVGRHAQIRFASLCVLCLATVTSPAGAADGKRLSVTGTGTLKVQPDVVEVHGIVIGQAELAADALKQLRDNKRRAAETVTALKIEGLTFKSSGRNINSPNSAQQVQMIMSGQEGETPVASHVMFHESVTIRIDGIDKLDPEKLSETIVKIIDAAKDAALIIGPNSQNAYNYGNGSLVTFRVNHPEAAQQKAQELAAKDARAKAERLATLLGVKVGGVRSASETVTEMNAPYQMGAYYSQLANGMFFGGIDSDTVVSNSEPARDREIPVTATLQVEYEIAD